jgi:hypothetical protein
MLDKSELSAMDQRLSVAEGQAWDLTFDAQQIPTVVIRLPTGETHHMRLTRDFAPAALGDATFIANAPADLSRLLAAIRAVAPTSAEQLAQIRGRVASASAAPWRLYLESDSGSTGCNVICPSFDDPQAEDLYLWWDGKRELAPDAYWEFIAAARSDIPRLLAIISESELQT